MVHRLHQNNNRVDSIGSDDDPAAPYSKNALVIAPSEWNGQNAERPPPTPIHDAREDKNLFGSCIRSIATFFSYLAVGILSPCGSVCYCTRTVKEYERAVIFRMGCITGGAKGPGTFFILPCIDSYSSLDLRTKTFDIAPQEILTKDSVTVMVDAIVYYRVSDPVLAISRVENYRAATQLLAAATLRNVLGTKTMSQLLSDREHIAVMMKTCLDEATDPWGIKVERVEVKDVKMPLQLQRAMAAEAEASREAKAKLIAAEGEMAAAKALKEAADIMVGGGALQLRYLQTLNSIAAEKNSTIIFPLPMDIIAAFMKK